MNVVRRAEPPARTHAFVVLIMLGNFKIIYGTIWNELVGVSAMLGKK